MKSFGAFLSLFLALWFVPIGVAQDVLDGVYVPEHVPTRRVIPYSPLREADVMWAKRIWRVIDVRQKMNLLFMYPEVPNNNLMSLWDVIKMGVKEGTITAYSNPAFDDQFKTPMTREEVEQVFTYIDTIYVENFETGEKEAKVITDSLIPADIARYWIKEDWFFDKQRSVMEARIVGICPLKYKKDENGLKLGVEPLFYIYYPQARYVFANAPVYNRHNDAEKRTYEDVFWKRTFNSYIFKESNVYDRKIIEYTKGLELQMEAERIKEEIFVFEHDLWHF